MLVARHDGDDDDDGPLFVFALCTLFEPDYNLIFI